MSDETQAAQAVPAAKPPKIKVKQFDGAQARKDITYSIANLSGAMQDQASLRLHYGEISAEMTRKVDDLKLVLEVTESTVYRELRDQYSSTGEKITEARLEKEVAVHTKVIAIKRAINEAKQVQATAKSAYEAFGDRKDMLIQLGAKDRAELEGELRMKVAGARDDAIKSSAQDMLARRNAVTQQ